MFIANMIKEQILAELNVAHQSIAELEAQHLEVNEQP
jgi:hypothetical protein